MSEHETMEVGSRYDLRAGPLAGRARHRAVTKARSATFGWVHSYETGSTVDGPGVRVTLFMSGCLLRCQYCHNPDTWHLKDGTRIELAQAVRRLGDFAPALRAMGGGLTISGGEPLVQIGFTRGMFAAAKRMGLHTALDTSGFLGDRADDEYLRQRRSGAARHQERRSRHLSQGDRRRTRADAAVRRAAERAWASRSGSASCWCPA